VSRPRPLSIALLAPFLLAPAASVAQPAGPASLPPQGRKCGFNTVTDLTAEPGWQIAALNAGPLVTLTPGALVCTIQINQPTHNGPASRPARTTSVASS
jgi:hypothetical protein